MSGVVPKKERIQQYRGLIPVLDAANDADRLRRDFVVMEMQMSEDLRELQRIFDQLWAKSTEDLSRLVYEEHHESLLKKYDIRFLS